MARKPNSHVYKGDSTDKSERYLAYVEQFGPNHGPKELARLSGCSRNAIYMWRKNLPGFKEREDAIKKQWDDEVFAKAKASGHPGIDLVKSLSPMEAKFINHYLRTSDRGAACAEVGVSWAYMEGRIEENPSLKAAYEAVVKGLVAANEDTVLRRGATGDIGAAKITLKAHMPARYGDRVEVNRHTSLDVHITGDETIRQLGGWIGRFGRLQPAGEFRRERLLDDGETIEAETIEAEAVAVS